MPVAAPFGLVEIGGDVFVRIGKSLIPRADRFLFLRENVSRLDASKRIARLCVGEVDTGGVQRVSNIVVERIGIEIPVYARDRDHESIRLSGREEQCAVQHRPSPGGDIEFYNVFLHNAAEYIKARHAAKEV